MDVHIAGSLQSEFLYESYSKHCDQEGLLLGQRVTHTSSNITDTSSQLTKSSHVAYIQDYIPCSQMFSWYDVSGKIDPDKLRLLMDGINPSYEVIGWYKMRRNSFSRLTVREKAVHRHLVDVYHPAERFVFLLFNNSCSNNKATSSVTQTAHVLHCGRDFSPIGLYVKNLAHTGPEYHHGSNQYLSQTGGLHKVFTSHESVFYKREDDLKFVTQSMSLQMAIHGKIQALSSSLCVSEQDLRAQADRISALRMRVAQCTAEVGAARQQQAEARRQAGLCAVCRPLPLRESPPAELPAKTYRRTFSNSPKSGKPLPKLPSEETEPQQTELPVQSDDDVIDLEPRGADLEVDQFVPMTCPDRHTTKSDDVTRDRIVNLDESPPHVTVRAQVSPALSDLAGLVMTSPVSVSSDSSSTSQPAQQTTSQTSKHPPSLDREDSFSFVNDVMQDMRQVNRPRASLLSQVRLSDDDD